MAPKVRCNKVQDLSADRRTASHGDRTLEAIVLFAAWQHPPIGTSLVFELVFVGIERSSPFVYSCAGL